MTEALAPARERRNWIVEPDGTPHPGTYRANFSRRGPWVPVLLERSQPVDPDTGGEMDRSPRWKLRIGYHERAEFDPAHLPSMAGEPIDPFEYATILEAGEWRETTGDEHERNYLYR